MALLAGNKFISSFLRIDTQGGVMYYAFLSYCSDILKVSFHSQIPCNHHTPFESENRITIHCIIPTEAIYKDNYEIGDVPNYEWNSYANNPRLQRNIILNISFGTGVIRFRNQIWSVIMTKWRSSTTWGQIYLDGTFFCITNSDLKFDDKNSFSLKIDSWHQYTK